MTEVKYRGNKPEKQRKEDAAYDLRANHEGFIPPGCRALVSTGTQVAVPQGMAGLVLPRSGLALKNGITVLNAPGLIDPDYVGDVGVILHNTDKHTFYYEQGDRIAQLMFVDTPPTKLVKSQKKLASSVRGDSGFGSSGVA